MKNLYCNIDVTKATQSGKAVEIEGFANKAVIDRGNDFVDPYGMALGNFKQNPIMLFNHNPDMPIGKIIAVEPTDEGLKVRGRLSRANDGPVKFVREMIADGTLQTFSIGFNVGEEEKDEKGVNIIKSGELLEVSVVSVPMNQESTFDVVSKAMTNGNYIEAKCKILEAKGAKQMAVVHKRLDELVKEGHYRKSFLTHIAEEAELEDEKLEDILAGNQKASNVVLEAMNEVLGLELKGDSEDDKEDEDEPKDDKGMEECVAAKLPKLISEGKDRDEAMAIAISMCSEENKCELTDAEKSSLVGKLSDVGESSSEDEKAETPDSEKAGEVEAGTSNAMMIALGQSNATLGAILLELQNMNKALDGLVVPNAEDKTETVKEDEKPEEEEEENQEDKGEDKPMDEEEDEDEEEKSGDSEEEDEEEEDEEKGEEAAKKIEETLTKLVEIGEVSDIDLSSPVYASISDDLRVKIVEAQKLDSLNKYLNDLGTRIKKFS